MKHMKKLIIAAAVLAALVAVIPLWGSCDLKARLCTSWCSIKHFNNDMKASGCRTRCSMEKSRCHGREAAEGFNDFVKGLQRD